MSDEGGTTADGAPVPFYASRRLHLEVIDAETELHIEGSPVEGDVDFYLERAQITGGPVLDAGCGTGRVSIPLVEAGFDVTGVDLSAAMLALAGVKRSALPPNVAARLQLVEGDIAGLALGRRFNLIITPGRVFQFLLTPEAQRAALEAFAQHLAPGGQLVLDLFDPRLEWCTDVPARREPAAPRAFDEVRHPGTGNRVRIEVTGRVNDPLRQVFHETWRHTELDADGLPIRSEEEALTLRWTYRWEMRHLLELCGYEVVAEYWDFRGSPPAYAREQVWVVTRQQSPGPRR